MDLPRELAPYLSTGGKVLAAGAVEPQLQVDRKLVKRRTETRSAYLRIQDRTLLLSLASTNLLFLDGPFPEYEPSGKAALTLIPPSMYGPPGTEETNIPGVLIGDRTLPHEVRVWTVVFASIGGRSPSGAKTSPLLDQLP